MSEINCNNCPFEIKRNDGKTYCIQQASCEKAINWLKERDKKIREDAIEEFKLKLIALINNSKFIDKYGDMVYAMDLAIDFGLLEKKN